MARFLDLPCELVLGVIGFIPPEDLENFAQTCQRIHYVAGSALAKHRLLIRRYSTMKNEGGRTISKTLKEVLVNPEIGRHIRNVSLDYIGGSQRNFNPKYIAEDLELFATASTNSQFLAPIRQMSLASHKRIIERGDEDILLAILLPLLPNLSSLRISRVSSDMIRCWTSEMFSCLPYVSTPTCTKLSTVCINFGEKYFHLDEAKVYANLPSVESLSALGLYCEDRNRGSPISIPNSNITNLELWECKVPAKPLHDFLLGFHSLQSFTYSCDLPEHMADKFDAFLIRSALLAKAKNTLRKLTMFACHRRSSLMGTLRPFQVLDEVCTDWGLLLSDRVSLGSGLRLSGSELRLAISLPSSLRKLSLHDEECRSAWHYGNLMDNIVRAQKRGTHVQPQPHEDTEQFEWGLQLQELTISSSMVAVEWWTNYPQDVKGPDDRYRDCEKVGIALHHCVRRRRSRPEN